MLGTVLNKHTVPSFFSSFVWCKSLLAQSLTGAGGAVDAASGVWNYFFSRSLITAPFPHSSLRSGGANVSSLRCTQGMGVRLTRGP